MDTILSPAIYIFVKLKDQTLIILSKVRSSQGNLITVRQTTQNNVSILFRWLRQRTHQYAHRCIRKHDGVLFKKLKLRYRFLVKQQKEGYELKSTYQKYLHNLRQANIIIFSYRVETQFTYLQQFYIHSLHTYIVHMFQPISSSRTFYSPSCPQKVECCIGQQQSFADDLQIRCC